MILLAMGLPGRFAQWCDSVLARLAALDGGAVVSKTWPSLNEMFGFENLASTLDEIGRTLIGNTARHVVLGVRQPDARLRGVLAERNTRFLLVLDDPRDSAADILAESGAAPGAVVRAVANSCPLIMQYGSLPGALTLRVAEGRADPAGAVGAIAAHLGIAVDQGMTEAIARDIGDGDDGPQSSLGDAPAAARKLIDGALSGYRHWFAEGRLDEIIWPRGLFYVATTGGHPIAPIDIVGGNTILIYGPYIHLPPGSWNAQVVLGFSAETVGHTFMVDVYSDGQLASTSFQPASPGVYHADLVFSLGEPRGKGVEVRVMTASEGARGQLAFGHVVLRPLAVREADPERQGEAGFAYVLGL